MTMQALGSVDSIVCSKAAFISERGRRFIHAFKVGNTMVENQVREEDKDGLKQNNDVDASTNSSSDSIDLNKDELDYIPS